MKKKFQDVSILLKSSNYDSSKNSFYNKIKNKNKQLTYNIKFKKKDNIKKIKRLAYKHRSYYEAKETSVILLEIFGLKDKYIFEVKINKYYNIHYAPLDGINDDDYIDMYMLNTTLPNIEYTLYNLHKGIIFREKIQLIDFIDMEYDDDIDDDVYNIDGKKYYYFYQTYKVCEQLNYIIYDKCIDISNINNILKNNKYELRDKIEFLIEDVLYNYIMFYDDFYYYKYKYEVFDLPFINHILSNISIDL